MARYRNTDWLSVLKKNRHVETHSCTLKAAEGKPVRLAGPQRAVEDLVPLSPPTAYRAVTVREKTSWTFTLAVRLPGLGTVRLVVSFKRAELTGTAVVLVTNRVDWHAQRIMTLYLHRWPIETFYQDGKTPLGLDEYRLRHAEAMGKHWCLVFVAYAFLGLDHGVGHFRSLSMTRQRHLLASHGIAMSHEGLCQVFLQLLSPQPIVFQQVTIPLPITKS